MYSDICELNSISASISEILNMDKDCIECEPLDENLIMQECLIPVENHEETKDELNQSISGSDDDESINEQNVKEEKCLISPLEAIKLLALGTIREKVNDFANRRKIQQDIRFYL